MQGNCKNLGKLSLQIVGQGDARLIAESDNMTAARIHLTDYRQRRRNPDRMHLARVLAEAPAMLEALREARRMLVEDEGYKTYNPRIREFDAILARIDDPTAKQAPLSACCLSQEAEGRRRPDTGIPGSDRRGRQ